MEEGFLKSLMEENLIDQEKYQKIFDIHRDSNDSYPSIIIESRILTEDQLLERMEKYYETTAISLDEFEVDPEATQIVPERVARQLQVVPLFVLKDSLAVAIENPYDMDSLDYLKIFTGLKIQPFVSLKNQILQKLDRVYVSKEGLEEAIRVISQDTRQQAELEDYLKDINFKADEKSPVVKLVNYIVHQGYFLGASDIHLEPLRNRVSLRFRIDGILHEFPGPPKVLFQSIVTRIKIIANLDVAERRHPQDGRINLQVYGQQIDLRVSIMPFIYGEGVAIRILYQKSDYQKLNDLGFELDDLDKFKRVLKYPFGLILVTGPTGSGKSTSLFSALNYLNSPDKKIITLEDPVEHRISGVMQLQVREDIELPFAMGLKAVLRHDPDIVMLGEIRDQESAEITIRLALTGQLVLSTLHTSDASTAIDRLIEMGVPSYLVSETLICSVAQRLLRRLCPDCREKDDQDYGLKYMEGKAEGYKHESDFDVYKAVGCKKCNNFGYLGRTAIFEILINDWSLKAAVPRRDFDSSHVRAFLRSRNIRSLREAALLKAIRGQTSMSEVFAHTIEDVYE